MAVKLIVTDLDGTLMSPDHQTVSERTKNALKTAHDNGVKIAIATGRTLTFTDNVTSQVPFVDYVIYSNGAAVFDRNARTKIAFRRSIPRKSSLCLTASRFIITSMLTAKFFFKTTRRDIM